MRVRSWFRRWLAVGWLCLPTLAVAAPPADSSAPAVEAARLVVFQRDIMLFRVPLFGASPAERAERAEALVDQALAQQGPLAVAVQQSSLGQLVLVGNRLAFVVTGGDADPLAQETAQTVAERAAGQLRAAVAATREASNLRALTQAVGLSLLATALYGLALWGWLRLRRMLAARLVHLADRKVRTLKIGNTPLFERRHLYLLLGRALTACGVLLILLLTDRWLSFVLLRFPYTRPWGEQLDHYLLALFGGLVESMAGAMPGLIVALAIFFLARMATVFAGHISQRLAENGSAWHWLSVDTLPTTRRLFSFAIWLFALAMAYPYLPGAQTEAFKGLSVLLGLMVTLGASSMVGQGAAGLILTYTRTFRPGEYVRVGEHEGTVMEMGLFTTRIRTGMGEELTLPNALITSSVTRNYSRTVVGAGYIVDTSVSIGYDTPWRQVEAMLIEAARLTPGILAEPAPRVYQTALGDFYPVYRLVAQAVPTAPQPRAEVLSVLHANIQDVFNRYGVQIMSPHYMADTPVTKVVAPEDWYRPPAA
ncbi:MAG: mechanosensitive ion channel family protein [Paludibacterium sp.]|uniref:mechanosensitive ion channel family protein n=1 Tax=Paludibacterium sp. TaxID=1917523 RepID=UPI0025E671F8|nr:mechanosensitive ion channel family protein [Paludibacterium sp.]MBV8047129.1 mechanosensitive ion channel family protein [Paludibacterium sp.]MBV8648740.1 mechanosensitive ion channel family protein [Paludibacterium sp.]